MTKDQDIIYCPDIPQSISAVELIVKVNADSKITVTQVDSSIKPLPETIYYGYIDILVSKDYALKGLDLFEPILAKLSENPAMFQSQQVLETKAKSIACAISAKVTNTHIPKRHMRFTEIARVNEATWIVKGKGYC